MKQDIENIIKKCKRCGLPQSEWKGRWEKPLCKVGETTYEQHILEETESKSIKEQLEEVVRKHLPEKKKLILGKDVKGVDDYWKINGFNKALSQINTSLIADEVLKVVVEKIREFKCEVPPTPNNLGKIYTEEMVNKVIKYVGRFNYNKALDDLLSNLSPNKENKNNEEI